MEIYKISKHKYSGQLTASGHAGRWNYKGQEVIYTASSRALASLEVMVHLSGIRLSSDVFKITVIHVPADVHINHVPVEDIQPGWGGLSSYSMTQPLGSSWIRSRESCVLRVPSSIIQHEFNFLINPNHEEIGKLVVVDVEDFLYDPRLLEKFKPHAI